MRGHLWEYDTGWDPEGILSTVPCVALALLGVLSGGWLNGESKASPALAFIVGLILHLVGVAWGTYFPINQIITTSSFVLFVGGVGIMLLVACHVLIDRLRLDRFAYPVVSLGKNALFIYVFSELLTDILYFTRFAGEAGGKLSLHKWLFGKVSLVVEGCYAASLVWAIGYMAILTALAVLMNRKKLIVRL